ncbi:MAG: T9SS type A sorting domain-containing protein [Bacteroidetes bacterium]|nr:T9SS type A sorting domain-containing protein [Bacteroidota bacterium]
MNSSKAVGSEGGYFWLEAGIYLLQVVSENTTLTRKIVVTHF